LLKYPGYAEEILCKFLLEVMKLIFILTQVLIQVFRINLGEVIEIEGSFEIDAFIYAKNFWSFLESIKDPLLEENISSDEVQEPDNLLYCS